MKNKTFLKGLLAFVFAFGLFAFIGFGTHAAESGEEIVDTLVEETTTEEVTEEEEATLTEEDKGKIDQIIEWISSLDKEELMEFVAQAKNWLVAGGIITILGFLSAIIGFIAACLKLAKEKVNSSNMSEKQKEETLDKFNKVQEKIIEGNNQIKTLLLNVINNMSDDEKKSLEANVNDVKAKILEALETSKSKEEE